MTASPTSTTARRTGRRIAVAVLGAGILLGATAGTASAKEIGSGGTPVSATCNPVSSMSYRGDARVGETGTASITVDYGVKPCAKGQVVTVETQLYKTATPDALAYDDTAAPLSGRYAVTGVTANTSYTAKVIVRDASTGAVVGTRQIFAAAIYKGV